MVRDLPRCRSLSSVGGVCSSADYGGKADVLATFAKWRFDPQQTSLAID